MKSSTRTRRSTPAPESAWNLAVPAPVESLPPSDWSRRSSARAWLGVAGAGRYALAVTEPPRPPDKPAR